MRAGESTRVCAAVRCADARGKGLPVRKIKRGCKIKTQTLILMTKATVDESVAAEDVLAYRTYALMPIMAIYAS